MMICFDSFCTTMARFGKMRTVLGILKDQTTIGLMKLASSRVPELDVPLVKSTSHNDIPANEKHVHQIIQLTSYSRGYAKATVEGLGNRLCKTRNWIVATKALILIHRLLKDGDPWFEEELFLNRQILKLSGFRDDSHSSAWDFSTFVRTYSLYLSDSVDSTSAAGSSIKSNFVPLQKDNARSSFREYRTEHNTHGSSCEYKSDGNGYRSGYGKPRYEHEKRSDDQEERIKQLLPDKIPFKDMPSDELLERLSFMQLILERVLACRPTGDARYHQLVIIALCSMVRESFKLYSDLCEGITVLLDGFYDIKQHSDRVKAFDIYSRSGKQFESLSSFYKMAKSMGVCRPSEYPSVQRASSQHLATLKEFLKDKSRSELDFQRAQNLQLISEAKELETEGSKQVVEEASNTLVALPAPPRELRDTDNDEKHQNTADFITFEEPTSASKELEDKLALALFSSTESIGNENMNLALKESKQHNIMSQGSQNPSWLNGSDYGKRPGWELALVSEAINIMKSSHSMAGGFSSLLLDRMYDQAANSRHYGAAAAFSTESASSAAVARISEYGILAAPSATQYRDPNAASANIAPPPYIQVNDLRQKHHFLAVQEQLWHQYQRNAMQGTIGTMQSYHNPRIPYTYVTGGGVAPQHRLVVPYSYGVNNFTPTYCTRS